MLMGLPNPYENDKNSGVSKYAAFNETGNTPCSFTTGHKAICSRETLQDFKILFVKPDPGVTIDSRRCNGQTTENPFRNPYSTRRLQMFQVSLYKDCNLNNVAIV